MKKGTHIQTDFIKFIIEKYSKPKKVKDEDEDEETKEPEIQDEEEHDEDEKPELIDDDEVLEKLINEYKKVKRKYENSRIQVRRK